MVSVLAPTDAARGPEANLDKDKGPCAALNNFKEKESLYWSVMGTSPPRYDEGMAG